MKIIEKKKNKIRRISILFTFKCFFPHIHKNETI